MGGGGTAAGRSPRPALPSLPLLPPPAAAGAAAGAAAAAEESGRMYSQSSVRYLVLGLGLRARGQG